MNTIHIPVRDAYNVYIERGILSKCGPLIEDLIAGTTCAIITDDNVDKLYADTLIAALAEAGLKAVKFVFPHGEASKCSKTLLEIYSFLCQNDITRADCLIALGGGVVGDLTGFAAATYLRGIRYIQIPTSLLAQVDSSVGGKTAINLDGMKNIVGAFRQPKKVLIDPDTLRTLPPRQVSNGLAEAVKMALTSDAELFRLFETQAVSDVLDTVIERSVRTKADVVAQDETEQGLRRVLNFGHTIGHAIESFEGLHGLYHGECVALGMLPMCSETVRARLVPVLEKLGLPTALTFDEQAVRDAMIHDKKMQKDGVVAVYVDSVGSFRLKTTPVEALTKALALIPKGETTR